jgi:hypothetical protein
MVKTSASSMSKLIDDLLYSKNVENNEGKLDVQNTSRGRFSTNSFVLIMKS